MAKNLAFNVLDDDLTMRNYLALFVCIINPKMTYSKALRLFEIDCSDNRKRKVVSKNQIKNNKNIDLKDIKKICVVDIISENRVEFTSIKSIENTLCISRKTIKNHINKNQLFLNRYKFVLDK